MGKSKAKKITSLKNNSDTASLIVPPFLYLGPCSAASSTSFISSNRITHILSIGATPTAQVEGIMYERLSLSDSPSSSIDKISGPAISFIEAAATSHNGSGKILVHCSAAISRSPTIVVAYLMRIHNLSLREALGRVIRARPIASPNPGFIHQLKQLELQLFDNSSFELEELPKRRDEREALFTDNGDEDQAS